MYEAEAQSWLLSYPKYVSEKRRMQAYWWSGYGACISALLISKTKKQPGNDNNPHKSAQASEFVRGTSVLSLFLASLLIHRNPHRHGLYGDIIKGSSRRPKSLGLVEGRGRTSARLLRFWHTSDFFPKGWQLWCQ